MMFFRGNDSLGYPKARAFTLLELMVVIAIIAIMLAAIVPAVNSLSKANGSKSAVSSVINALEQAKSLAVTSGSATYVVFADQSTPDRYRNKAFIVFQDDKNFAQVPVTKWSFLPVGVSFRPNEGILTLPSSSSALMFACPSPVGPAPAAYPYVKFDPNGSVTAPSDPNILFIDLFAGFVGVDGLMSYTDANQKTSQKFDAVVLARFTGRAKYVDPYSG